MSTGDPMTIPRSALPPALQRDLRPDGARGLTGTAAVATGLLALLSGCGQGPLAAWTTPDTPPVQAVDTGWMGVGDEAFEHGEDDDAWDDLWDQVDAEVFWELSVPEDGGDGWAAWVVDREPWCEAVTDTTVAPATPDCDGCTHAYALTLGSPSVESDDGGGAACEGAFEAGTELTVGYAPGDAEEDPGTGWWRVGGVWQDGGLAFVEDEGEGPEWFFVLPVEAPTPSDEDDDTP
jgi:hypothetical protein